MNIIIKEAISKSDMKKFVAFPFKLYAKNKYWIPPLISNEIATLDRKKNPAFDYCKAKYWLAYRDGKIAGRIAGIINDSYIKKWKNKYARFGWIDFIDDTEVSKALLSTVEKWAMENGLNAVHGPLGFTDLDYEGMLVEGFEELGTMATIFNYPYYPVHLKQHGYAADISWIEFEIKPMQKANERLERLASLMEKKLELTIVRTKKAREILPYAREIFDVMNSAYENLYGVVALTDRQVEYYIKLYFGFIRAEFVSIILDKAGQVVAFGITMPSLSLALQKAKGRLFPFGFIHLMKAMKKNDRADLLLVGIRPDYQRKGLNAILMSEMNKVYLNNHIKVAESNPELETNVLIHSFWKSFDSRQHKKRTCFIKQLSTVHV
ncbi:MAG TPA: hypothetical protein VI757_04925 [Bacteroidia bacterium]|nr:hypothetical protein [Bacteroidia bacterium]